MRRATRNALGWLGVEAHEVRQLLGLSLGAFLLMSLLTLVRTMRETLFLERFGSESLPYVMISVAVASVPFVHVFSRRLKTNRPGRVLGQLTVLIAVGMLPLWPFLAEHRWAVSVFFVWSAVTTILLSTCFWLIVARSFMLRGAKRMFGLISAGGTLGIVATGFALSILDSELEEALIVPLSVGVLFCFLAVVHAIDGRGRVEDRSPGGGSQEPDQTRARVVEILRQPHTRRLAIVVLIATFCSSLVDFRFKELAEATHAGSGGLAGYLGTFYGVCGALSLAAQVVLTSRIITATSVTRGLLVFPLFLILGSTAMLLVPGLLAATLMRGGDKTIRSALYRPLLELIYIPMQRRIRETVKPFVDSVVESAAEGLAGIVLILWIKTAGLPGSWLPAAVLVLAGSLFIAARRLGGSYYDEVANRIQEKSPVDTALQPSRIEPYGSFDLSMSIVQAHSIIAPGDPVDVAQTDPPLADLGDDQLRTRLDTLLNPSPESIPELVQQLARNAVFRDVAKFLARLGAAVVPELSRRLLDDAGDYRIRRRIPGILSRIPEAGADDALVGALTTNRFLIRYRAAMALSRRRRRGFPSTADRRTKRIWRAARIEVQKDRAVWELQGHLKDMELEEDNIARDRVVERSSRSLEHVFRLFTLVLDPKPLRAAYRGASGEDERMRDYALEYLDHVLPPEIYKPLSGFIGGRRRAVSDDERRPLDTVIGKMMAVDATILGGRETRAGFEELLDGQLDDGDELPGP